LLEAPHITEKATDLARKNQYVFKVRPRANKTEVKKAIEDVFGVEVTDVKIVNLPGKEKKVGEAGGL